MNRIHIITLGVKNIKESLRFYRDVLGFKAAVKEEEPQIVFFQSEGATLALYPKEGIAKDINAENPPIGNGFGGITLAHNTSSEEEVREILKKAESGGGKIEKQPRRVRHPFFVVDRLAGADAGQHFMRVIVVLVEKVHIVGRHGRGPDLPG